MTQDAVVIKLLPKEMAEVAVTRSTACGGNCGSCESCMFQKELHVEARNLIQAKPGQKVVISSKSSRIFGAAFLVYIMPLLFFFAGYAVAALADAGEGIRILVSFCSLLFSAAVLVFTQRRTNKEKTITFDIIA
ncbi:MAG: SoxR reducing system RseC family protein [Oscillospiraceae bacterium]|jgi:sigma-E factor negative regulatory protein RseC|nr:SoxR reducing system RseC family protein [Oscillospiraceae bacterium]